jgi:predicted unusual protein kinase regulating ubiquinone biosynthesis (AarF/ABC1/UbiB family)
MYGFHLLLSDLYTHVQVQHPGVQELMMTDIRNLKTFAAYLQKTDIKFDLVSVVQEVEKQVFLTESEYVVKYQG